MKINLVFVLLFLSVSIYCRNAELVYSLDLDSDWVRSVVEANPIARLEKDETGETCLTITVTQETFNSQKKDDTTYIPQAAPQVLNFSIDFESLGITGKQICGEADIRFHDVSKPHHRWNGVKFNLIFKSHGDTCYPSFITDPSFGYGNHPDWFKASCIHPIADDVQKAALSLGLQDSTGSVSFKNVRIYKLNQEKTVLEMENPPQAVYTDAVKSAGIRRGVMSPAEFRPDDFRVLKEWGVNLIRWQMDSSDKKRDPQTYLQALMPKIDELGVVLDEASKNGFQVVVDLHPLPNSPFMIATAEGRACLLECWKVILERYANHPAIWGYDILNEPSYMTIPLSQPDWPAVAQTVIDLIRSYAPETPVIVETEMTSECMLHALPVFSSPNIIYSLHFYEPSYITHLATSPYPCEEKGWNKDYLRLRLKKAREFQLKTGARIYVGEFGCLRWVTGGDQYILDCIEIFEEYGWDWTYHAFREWDGWSAEHGPDPKNHEILPMTLRKAVLLNYFR